MIVCMNFFFSVQLCLQEITSSWGEVLPEKLDRVSGPLPKTLTLFMTKICYIPYPIYDLTLWSLGEGLLFLVSVKGVKRGRRRQGAGGRRWVWWKSSFFVKKSNWRPECKSRYPIYDQNGGKMAKIDTQFMTKTAEKPYPLEPHIPV